MRVAYVCADTGVPVFGPKGCSVHVQEVVRALAEAGADVHVFAARLGDEPEPGLPAAAVHLLEAPGAGGAGRERAAVRVNRALAARLRREGPFDLVYERHALWSCAAMEHARLTGAAGLLEVNAPLVEEQAAFRGLRHRAAAERLAARAFRAADALLAVSAPLAEWLERHPAARGRVHVLPNAVREARFARLIRPVPAPGSFTVGFVGSLKPWHGLDVMADAFALLRQRVPQARLLVVGDGPGRAALEDRLIAGGARDAARLVGAVPPAEVPALLAAMDVGLAPYALSRHFYFSPLKVYEYMAAGLPVVASGIGQLRELIRDGEEGILCPPGDARALAAALQTLAAQPAHRLRMGASAREKVLRDHTWAAVAERILDLAAAARQRAAAPAAAHEAAGLGGS